MKKIIFLAIAMMFSASIAFGQDNTSGSSNPNEGNQSPIPVDVNAISPSEYASYATITYRWNDGVNGWGPWFTSNPESFDLGWVHFQLECYLTNSAYVEMEYHLIAYQPNSVQITQTCGTELIPKSGTVINITTWNAASCLNIGPVGPIEKPEGGQQN